MLANSNTIAPLTANRGNFSTRDPADSPTVYRPADEYTKVATNTLSTIWLARSRRNFRSSRGENCVEDSCSATTVRPRTNAMTVTTVPAMIVNNARASSAVPWNANGDNGDPGATSIPDITNPTTSATTALTPGQTHSDPFTYSRTAPRLVIGTAWKPSPGPPRDHRRRPVPGSAARAHRPAAPRRRRAPDRCSRTCSIPQGSHGCGRASGGSLHCCGSKHALNRNAQPREAQPARPRSTTTCRQSTARTDRRR